MPFELPNLDDRTYDQLVDEARAAIPGLSPEWTDHNASDPGIALIELFAWLTEMMLYRTNRISEKGKQSFLTLLRGGAPLVGTESIDEAIRLAVVDLRERYRAVTYDDFEYLLKNRWPNSPEAASLPLASQKLQRAFCLAERNLGGTDKLAAAPGHISLVILPESGAGTEPWLTPSALLLEKVAAFFRDRTLITTRLHVVGPDYVTVPIHATLKLKDDARPSEAKSLAIEALVKRFHPCQGGIDGKGWTAGRSLHASEVYAILDGVRGVEFVENATIAGAPVKTLDPHQLPKVGPVEIVLTLQERLKGVWTTVNL